MNTFFKKIFDIYSNVPVVEKNKDFYKIDKLVYYLADIENSVIRANNIWEIDIQAAFSTFCHFLFPKDDPFIKKLETFEDKFEKNKFIAINLKGTKLKELNYLSKMVICSCLMNADPNATILELKKDGIIYIGESIQFGKLFKEYSNMGITIRSNKFNKYIRYRKTSHFINDKEIIIKGIYKDRPAFLSELLEKIIFEKEINNFDEIDKIYSDKFYQIIRLNMLDELFSKYYICGPNNILNTHFKYEKIKNIYNCTNVLPKNYLKLFIYPFLVP